VRSPTVREGRIKRRALAYARASDTKQQASSRHSPRVEYERVQLLRCMPEHRAHVYLVAILAVRGASPILRSTVHHAVGNAKTIFLRPRDHSRTVLPAG